MGEMNFPKNEKGFTLIEVLLSITILFIVLITFMNFFPQMGLMIRQNEEKMQAENLAKQIMVKWKESKEVKTFILEYKKNNSGTLPQNDVQYDNWKKESNYLLFTSSQEDLKIEVKIFLDSDLGEDTFKAEAHQIHVFIKNKKGNLIGESYGYVIVERS
jgi:prepilin-type N-terminal cleavage/methylation domain-containing protein